VESSKQAQNIAEARDREGNTALWLEPDGEPAISDFFTGTDPESLEMSFPVPATAADDRAQPIAATAGRAAVERKARKQSPPVERAAPEPEPEVKELLSSADQERRRGDWSAAAETYARVAEHKNGAPYAEEALLRRAQILAAHETIDGALAALSLARDRFPEGTLATERAVLEAQLYLRRFDAESAADAIERAGGERTLAVLRARLEVAEALVDASPERAKSLVQPVLASKVSSELGARARRIDSGAKGNE
jgi:tetratricopeptide (TPR) repeat protein